MAEHRSGIGMQVVVFRIALAALSALLLLQYFHNRSLWIDEAMLALNIINRSPAGLFKLLDDHQVAPILFLLIEKCFTAIFGNTELALRLLPLLSALICLPLVYRLTFQFTRSRPLALCAMILLGCTTPFVYYSSEVKQYSTDVLVLLSIYAVAFIESPFLKKWRTPILSITGAIAVFLSNTSVIALFTVGLFYVYQAWKEKKISANYWIPALTWAFFFGINYLMFIKDHPYAQFMKNFWANTFMPLNIFGKPFHKWVDRTVVQFFRDLLPSVPGGYLFFTTLLLYLFSLVMMVRKKEFRLLYLCLAPAVIHLCLSSLQLYPFDLRLILYQAPLHIIILAYGIRQLAIYFPKPGWVMIIATALLCFKLFTNYPIDHDELRPAILYIGRHVEPGETVYVSRGSVPGTRYYVEVYNTGIDTSHLILGNPPTNFSSSYLEDLSKVNGRMWLLLSHMYPFNRSTTEEDNIIAGLKKRGTLLQQYHSAGCTAYEFNLQQLPDSHTYGTQHGAVGTQNSEVINAR